MNESGTLRLAVDAHGGDFGVPVMAAAAWDCVQARPDLFITLVGDEQALRAVVETHERLSILHATEVLESDVGAMAAMRTGADSSMGAAMQHLADGKADAVISAGSTTALMALGMRVLGTVAGLKRPALMSTLPSESGATALLDLGANVQVDAHQLVQFAVMAAVVVGAGDARKPRIGLLNVGHEEGKGPAELKQAHDLLSATDLNYLGFVEGGDVFSGRVDIAVCDGFSGNLVLKSSEGLARMLNKQLMNSLSSSWAARLGAVLARRELTDMLARFDPAQHNGAPLLGLNGVVVKSHGSANRTATRQAILEAADEAQRHVPDQIQAQLKHYKSETNT